MDSNAQSPGGPPAGRGLEAVDFAAQSCVFCERACASAAARLRRGAGPVAWPALLDAIISCRRLMNLNIELLRQRSPLHPLMSAACVAACVLVCKAAEIADRACASRGQRDPLLKEVADTCWIAAHACREVVSAGPRTARAS